MIKNKKIDYRPKLLPNQYHHCVNHAIDGNLLFREDENYAFFLDKYKKYIAPITVTYAYCLMPNHFHFLIQIRPEEQIQAYYKKCHPHKKQDWQTFDYHKFISQQFSNFFNSYAKAYNKKYGRRGGLFEDYFKRPLITDENHFLNTLRYIHQNPIHHGFVDDLETWNYTSYPAFLNPNKKGFYKERVLYILQGLQGFIDFHQNYRLDEDYDSFID
jgi:REP element-mobilizing transposase RayT